MTTPEDDALLAALHDTRNPRTFVTRLIAYYRDRPRAERTPRELLVLHLGICSGVIERVLEEAEDAKRVAEAQLLQLQTIAAENGRTPS